MAFSVDLRIHRHPPSISVRGAGDSHVPRARRGRGRHGSRGGRGASIHPRAAERSWTAWWRRGPADTPRRLRSQPHLCREDQAVRRRHPNLVSKGMGQLVRTCQRYRLRELPACRSHGNTAPCDTGGDGGYSVPLRHRGASCEPRLWPCGPVEPLWDGGLALHAAVLGWGQAVPTLWQSYRGALGPFMYAVFPSRWW